MKADNHEVSRALSVLQAEAPGELAVDIGLLKFQFP
jgi:hypothetical protein